MLVYVDLEKADIASALWKHACLHAASHERYKKGETPTTEKRATE
jgi:hypothetical protein